VIRQLFVDLDGVLADFDGFYFSQFGIRPDRHAPDPPDFWPRIHRHGRFFRDLPMLPDALALWEGVKERHPEPIILTGVPKSPIVEEHKREWVREHISPVAPVICCPSRDKRKHAAPGDVLIDDWHRYRHLWEDMGGIFILHVDAVSSLAALDRVLAEDSSCQRR
jgi:5'(3')-deoxyribonucleotidase